MKWSRLVKRVLMKSMPIRACSHYASQSVAAPSCVNRLRPMSMAAVTTILGMLPLLGDVFFKPMAVTIMFGLGFATLLTLVIVPVLFALFYGVKEA